jgi:hypothetical protein
VLLRSDEAAVADLHKPEPVLRPVRPLRWHRALEPVDLDDVTEPEAHRALRLPLLHLARLHILRARTRASSCRLAAHALDGDVVAPAARHLKGGGGISYISVSGATVVVGSGDRDRDGGLRPGDVLIVDDPLQRPSATASAAAISITGSSCAFSVASVTVGGGGGPHYHPHRAVDASPEQELNPAMSLSLSLPFRLPFPLPLPWRVR